MKKIIAALLLACSFGAWAQEVYPETPRQHAVNGQVADVASTLVGLAVGASEANPLGILVLPIKFYSLRLADDMPPGEGQDQAYRTLAALGYGPAANTLCVILTIATGGSAAPACLLVGIATGLYVYNKE